MAKKNINDSNIVEIEGSSGLSLLKFSAEWCGPCQMFKPVYAEVANQHDDIVFGEIDIDNDEVKSIVSKYNVNTVPTTIIFKDGKEVERFSGYLPKEKFEDHIKKSK